MKQLAEFLPIVLFFIVYQFKGDTITVGDWTHTFDGIFSATAVLMAATAIHLVLSFAITRRLEKRQIWLFLAIFVFGGATLFFRNQMFIQWKPTIFNWVLAIAFGASQFVGEKNLMQRTLGSQLQLPRQVWTRLNLIWTTNFALVGSLNLYVAYFYSEETWVSYKLYSAIGFTVLLTILTAVLVSPHLREEDSDDSPDPQTPQ